MLFDSAEKNKTRIMNGDFKAKTKRRKQKEPTIFVMDLSSPDTPASPNVKVTTATFPILIYRSVFLSV